MIAFSPNNLSPTAQAHLDALQTEVNAATKISREEGYKKAADLWTKRKNQQADKPIWAEIEENLADAHPRKGLCQYCEFDRHAPTEHVFSKKHYPNRAFRWVNYLKICTKCNSEYKGDSFAVFNPAGSATHFDLPITRGTYPEPPNDDAVLIQPRLENPQDFMLLDLTTGKFIANFGTDDRGKAKAKYTIDLLHLNTDDVLLRHRKKAYFQYANKLETYSKIKVSVDFNSLLAALPMSKQVIVKQNNDFYTEKTRLLNVFENDIKDDLFPTVWAEMKAQRALFSHLNDCFQQNPETLTWE